MNTPATSNETVVALLMLRVEAALGNVRTVPVARAKQVGREVVSRTSFDNKAELQRLLDRQIEATYGKLSKEK